MEIELNSSNCIFSESESKELDTFTPEILGTDGKILMSLASASIFSRYADRFRGYEIHILTGSGNNGGDGIVLSYLFHGAGFQTVLYMKSGKHSNEYELHKQIAIKSGVKILLLDQFKEVKIETQSKILIIDALLGTGFEGKLRDEIGEIVEILRTKKEICKNLRILNIDTASGYDELSSNGMPVDILAEIGVKKFKNLYASIEAEEYSFHEIGFPVGMFMKNKNPPALFPKIKWIEIQNLCRRKKSSNKYTNGSSVFIGGSDGMSGAILLSQKIFHGLGGGISSIYTPSKEVVLQILKKDPSLMVAENPKNFQNIKFFQKVKSIVIGPGLNENEMISEDFLENKVVTIIDAGAILRAKNWNLHEKCILTPHDGELNSLSGRKMSTLSEKINFMLEFIQKKPCNILLKGPVSILCTHDRKVFVKSSPNAKLAVMGSGDILTGIIAFFSQRLEKVSEIINFSLSLMEKSKEIKIQNPTGYEILKYLRKQI